MDQTIPFGKTSLLDNELNLSNAEEDCLLKKRNKCSSLEKVPSDTNVSKTIFESYHRSNYHIITRLYQCFKREHNLKASHYVRKNKELNKWVQNYANKDIAKTNNSSNKSEKIFSSEKSNQLTRKILSKSYYLNKTPILLNEDDNHAKSKLLQSDMNCEESQTDQVESDRKRSYEGHAAKIEDGVKNYRTNNNKDNEEHDDLEFSKKREDNKINDK